MRRSGEGRRGSLAGSTALSFVILFILMFAPGLSRAASLTGDSRTYLQSSETAEEVKLLNGYEYLDFAVQDIGGETVSFHTGGWLRYSFRQEDFDKKSNSDLQYSYLRYARAKDNTSVNLGRVMVVEGVAAERVDGLSARTDLLGGFGISAFGGIPVETGIDIPGNNVIYGGRLAHQAGDVYQLGLSALKEEKNSEVYRNEMGIDLWLHPFAKADLTGRSSYNDVSRGWMEHSAALLLGPFANLRFDTTAQWIDYDHYFYRSTMNAFLLQKDRLVPHEKTQILGEEVSWAVTDKVLLAADYRNFTYDITGKAESYGGKIRYLSSSGSGAGIAYHRMDGETDTLRYDEYRVYLFKKAGGFDVTADFIDVAYDAPRNDVTNSYAGSLAAGYTLKDAWHFGADVEYSHNPDFDRDVRTLFKIDYRFGRQGGA